jgi:LPXTG-motif cell wall-anchored protein
VIWIRSEGTTELHNENLQEAEYNLGFLPTVVANEGYTFKGWKVTNKAGEEIYNLDANATSIAFPYGVADDYTVTAVLEKNETPVDPDQPSVDPSKPSTPEEKPGTSIEENKKDDKTSTTVAKDDKKTNKKESAKKANEQKSDTVQTGDHSNVFVYVATLLIAGAAAVVAFFRRRNA